MIRTFIAVDVPLVPGLRPIRAALARMGRAVQPVETEDLHVTVRFLGDVDEQQVGQLGGALSRAIQDAAPFEITLLGLGAFPHPDRPSVIWVGCHSGSLLESIAERLASELEPLGHPREQRPFHPHATIARVKARPPGELRELLRQHSHTEFGSVRCSEVLLYRSDLKPRGPSYTPLARAALSE